MGIEASIYNQLNDSSVTAYTGQRIYNTDPTENTDWPFVVYSVTVRCSGTP